MAKKLTKSKAKKILHDGTAHGKPLTAKQKRFFGAMSNAQDGKSQEKNYDDLYLPIIDKIMDSAADNWESLPLSNTSTLERILSGSVEGRNIPPMDDVIKEMQTKILALPNSEINKLLQIRWKDASIPKALWNKPSNVSTLEMFKYINHIKQLKKDGYTFQNGGEASYSGLTNKGFNYSPAWGGAWQNGGSNVNIDSVLTANKHLDFVKRMYEPNTPSINRKGESMTHFMESGDGMVYPRVIRNEKGKLKFLSSDKARKYAEKTGEYIKFDNDLDAQYFGANYKKGTGVLKEYQNGGEKELPVDILMRQAYKESTFNPKAHNTKTDAKGLVQLRDNAIADYLKAHKLKPGAVDAFKPEDAKKIQEWYMKNLYNSSFINKPNQDEKVRLAKTAAAYNWGRGNLFDHLKKQKEAGVDIYNSFDWLDNIPAAETKDYVNKIVLNKDEKFNAEYDSAYKANEKIRKLYGQKQYGGVIEDNMGQWKHPGKVTKINSNNITMEGVNYPVLGISDTGDSKVMLPENNYKFEGSSVTEFPMLKNGGMPKELDQLTNFTNMAKARTGKRMSKKAQLGDNLIKTPLDFASQVKLAMLNTEPGQFQKQPDMLEKLLGKPTKNKRVQEVSKSLMTTPRIKKHGGDIPDAQWGMVAPLINSPINQTAMQQAQPQGFNPIEQLGGPMGIATGIQNIVGGFQMMKEQKNQKTQAKRFNKMSNVIKQAAELAPDKVERKYVRPEDQIIDPNMLFPTQGVGTNYLKQGGEIQNTYAPNTLYTDLEEMQMGGYTNMGALAGSLLGGAQGQQYGQSQAFGGIGEALGSIIPIPGARQALGAVGGFIGGLVGAKQQKQINKLNDQSTKNLTTAAFTQGMRDNYTSFMRTGGNIRQNQAFDGDLITHWGGETEQISQNPYLPHGGETIEFVGNKHSERDSKGRSGIGITFGNSPVEVEHGEPAVKLQDGGTGGENLVVFGDMKIPSYGVSELQDPKAKGKKFKSYIKDLSEQEVKQNKVNNKGLSLINTSDPDDPFERLTFSSGKMLMEGSDAKMKEIAKKKQIAADIQNAILDTAEEFGLKSDELAKGNIKKAKKGLKIAQSGTEESISISDVPALLQKGARRTSPSYLELDEKGQYKVSDMNKVPNPDFEKVFADYRDAYDKGLGSDTFFWRGKEYTVKYAEEMEPTRTKHYRVDYNLKSPDLKALTNLKVPTPDFNKIPTTFGTQEQGSTEATGKGKGKNTDFDLTPIFNSVLPFIRPSNKMALDPNQLMGEMYALGTNQLEPVQAQMYNPLLEQVSDISLQDQLNANQADFNTLTRVMGNNPEALAALAAQKYQANTGVLGEQFRQNQAQKMGVYNRNRGILNDATLKNLAIMDQQYTRQATAKSKTKATAQAALSSIADKIAKNKLENKTLGIYENLYNYRFGPNGYAWNLNPLAQFDTSLDQLPTVDERGDVIQETGQTVSRDRFGIPTGSREWNRTRKRKNNNKANGGIVKSLKNR